MTLQFTNNSVISLTDICYRL